MSNLNITPTDQAEFEDLERVEKNDSTECPHTTILEDTKTKVPAAEGDIKTERGLIAEDQSGTKQEKKRDSASPSAETDNEAQLSKKKDSDISAEIDPHLPIGDYLKIKFVQYKVMPTCIDLFFGFPWNNFLHYVIYDMLHQVFNGRMDKGYNRNLAISVFKDGHLTEKMVQIQKMNDDECAKPKGMRLGFMGHLTFIADEIIKLLEGYPEAIVSEIKTDVDLESWSGYCNNELKETKERDRLPLGGTRPSDGMEAEMSDEEENEDVLDGTAATQYSRYLARRGADENIDEDEDEEEGDNWISGRDVYSHDYSYGGSFNMANHDENSNGRISADHDDNREEYGSDGEEDNNRETTEWSRGFSQFPHANMLHRTESRIHEEDDDLGDVNEYDDLADSTDLEKREASQETRTGENKVDDDPFGDFSSGDDKFDDTQWTSFTDKFENMQVTAISTTKGQDDNPTKIPEKKKAESIDKESFRSEEKHRKT
ncbi:hypothetical protein DFQ28_004386 [Apophysomyces sp. BC1034]|nr:hypothetical protein DFQ30_003631 [Apophysomyces sp. BC1015]KAG0188778.1 hypothetical protein DFQ28_004386 [Apophysomyces sp. BC1034]